MSLLATLLTTTHCSLCEQAEGVLRQLQSEGVIEVETVDLASPEGQRLWAAARVPFPPVLFLDDEPFSFGRLSERKLRRELARRHRAEIRPG